MGKMPQKKLHRVLQVARSGKKQAIFVCRNYVMSSFLFSEIFYGKNVKDGWTVKTRTAFSLAKPIWVLGKTFLHRPEGGFPRVFYSGIKHVKCMDTWKVSNERDKGLKFFSGS